MLSRSGCLTYLPRARCYTEWASPQYDQSISLFHLQPSPIRAEHPFLGISIPTALGFGFHILLEQHSDCSSPPLPGPANQAGRRRDAVICIYFICSSGTALTFFCLFTVCLHVSSNMHSLAPHTHYSFNFVLAQHPSATTGEAYPLHREEFCKPWLAGREAAFAHRQKWV